MNKHNIYRSDIQISIDDYKKANLIRVMQYEKEEYKIIDNKIFDKNNTEIILNIDDKYSYYDNHYSKLIPLWETDIKNAKKYPDLYNDAKWIIGKRENKRVHNKLLILDNGFKFKIGYLWKHQPFNQRPTYKNKFVKMFYAYDDNNNVIIENENWGAILSQVQQYIKDNARDYYDNYRKVIIKGYCKSENTEFDIVEFDILENKWY